MVTVKKVEFNKLKDCYAVSDGHTEAIITTHIGPRIISLTLNGKANHMLVDTAAPDPDKFNLWGGHRVWHAPEHPVASYSPDNGKCDTVEIRNDGLTVLSYSPETKLKKGFSVKMSEDGEISVTNTVFNASLFDVELSIWGLTVMCPGGVLAIPNSSLDTKLLPNRFIALWPYSKMTDPRVYWGDKFITLKEDFKHDYAFKLGASVDAGTAAYFNHSQMFVKKFDFYYGAEYPSAYSNLETYTCQRFTEFETLSPLMTVESGEAAEFTEVWRLYDNVETPARDDEKAIAGALALTLRK
jgi:hypothetical protein